MSFKHLSAASAVVLFLPVLAYAQTEDATKGASLLENVIWTILPFILIAGFIWFFFVRVVRKNQKRSDDYMARQKQHNERVEQLLERIAKAVEREHEDVG